MELNKPVVAVFATIGAAQLLFLVLKGIKLIDWSWGWIFAPLWVPYLLCLFILSLFAIYLIVANAKERKQNRGN